MSQLITPNDANIISDTDSKSIQRAVDAARERGTGKTVIPRLNKRTGEALWRIDKTVLLPSGMTVELDGCHLVMEDGVFCNMFRNENAADGSSLKPGGEQSDINIIGRGNAMLDGGNHNGLTEKTSLKDGNPHISENLTVFFHNVRNFKVGGFAVANQRWWGLCFMYCRGGRIYDLRFDAGGEAPNRDGVDLRVGCSDIIIEGITGRTGDDSVALTALLGSWESSLAVEGRRPDIHNVIIRDVMTDPYTCAVVRLLNHDGCRLYNIIAENLVDTSEEGSPVRPGAVLRIGENRYIHSRAAEPGETSGITASNIYSRARAAVCISNTLTDSDISRVRTFGDAGALVGTLGGARISGVTLNGEMLGDLK